MTSLHAETSLRRRHVLDLPLRVGPRSRIARALRDGFLPALALLPVLQGGCQVFNSPTERVLLELLSKVIDEEGR